MRLLIDLGGTNIKFAISQDGVLKERSSIPTNQKYGFKIVAKKIIEHIRNNYLKAAEIIISQAGIINQRGGVFYANDNLRGFTGKSLVNVLEKEFDIKVMAYNDVKSSTAYASMILGVTDATVITIGTGVGIGLILNGQVLMNNNGMIGEIGNVTVCEKRVDEIISLSSFVNRVREYDKSFDLAKIDYSNNDFIVLYTSYIDVLSVFILNNIFIYGNTNIYLGGNMHFFGEKLLSDILMKIKSRLPKEIFESVAINYLPSGNDANLYGAEILFEKGGFNG